MKILVTTDAYPPGSGGSGESTAALARALARRGHDVTVVVARRGVTGETARSDGGLRVFEIGLGSPPPGPGRTRNLEAPLTSFLIRQSERFDVAHAQHLLSATPTVLAGERSGYPVVVTVRDYWPVCIWSTRLTGSAVCPGCTTLRRVVCAGRRHPLYWGAAPFSPFLIGREIDRRQSALARARAVVAVSRYVKDTLSFYPDVRVIPNLLERGGTRRVALPAGLPEAFVLFVGKLEPNKAPDLVIPILKKSGLDLPLVVAGAGGLASAIQAAAREADIETHFCGWTPHDQTLALMGKAAAVVFPSRWPEPLSRVLLEGLGVGAVLVAQRAGGNEEIVVHGESGLTGTSVDEMAGELARACSDEALAARLREGARRRADARFSEDVVVAELEALYAQVVA